MGKLTWKYVLHPHVREDGTRQVRLRLTKDRVTRFVDVGITVPKSGWNEKAQPHHANWLRGSVYDFERLNEAMRQQAERFAALYREHPTWSVEQLRSGVAPAPEPAPAEKKPEADVLDFFASYIAGRQGLTKPGTLRLYEYLLGDLQRWRAGKPLPFVDLDEAVILSFYEWLRKERGNYAGTARDKIVKWGTVMRRARKRGLLPAHSNPFEELNLPRPGNKKPVRRPTFEEFEQIKALPLYHFRSTSRESFAHARRAWLLQHYLRGLRIGDVLLLRERDVREDRLLFAEQKTGKTKSIRRTPLIDELLAHYPPTGQELAFVFPYLNHRLGHGAEHPTPTQARERQRIMVYKIQIINRALRRLAEVAGVPGFTTHAARHLFVDRLEVAKVDGRTISSLLNHSNEATTRAYRRQLGYDDLDEAAERAFEQH